ncbi:MAG: restriction endonuclease subunit S [Methylocella sp.]
MALGLSPREIIEKGEHQLLAKARHWERVLLADVADVQNGFAFKSELFDRYEGIPLIRIRDISRCETEHRYKGEYDHAYLVHRDDILVGMDGDFVASRWRGDKALLNQRVCKLVVRSKKFDEKFFFLCLQPFLSAINAETSSVTVKHLSSRTIETILLPLPPLNEQHRIVTKIEALFSELENGIESLKTAQEQLRVYRQALLKSAFEGKITAQWREENKDKLEPPNLLLARIQTERDARYRQQLDDWKEAIRDWEVTGKPDMKPSKPRKPDVVHVEDVSQPVLPEGWVWGRLGNLNTDVFDGPFGSNLKTSDYVNEGVRVIRLENIGYLKFIDDKVSYITEEKYERLKKHTVRAGDIIFSSFVIDGIRLAILPNTIDRAVNKADCFCVRLHGESVRTDYAASFLSMRTAYKQIESEIHGIGRPRINTTQLKGFVIPLCSRAEQNEIMFKLSEKLSLSDNIDASLECEIEKCEVLYQSILKKAFSGRLVAQDPDDEPASVLLEQIKAEKAEEENGKKKIKRTVAA